MNTAPVTPSPAQPAAPRRDFARHVGLVVLFALSAAAAYAGLQFHSALLFVPLLAALLGVFLPRGNALRTVLFSIATVECVALVGIACFCLALFAMWSGAQFG